MEFSELDVDNKFIEAMTEIIKLISQKSMNFVNVQLVA